MKRLVPLLILLAVILAGVERYTEVLLKQPRPERKALTVAHGNEIAPLFRTLGIEFQKIMRAAPVDNMIPVVRNIGIHPMVMAKGADLAEGAVDVWISPHPYFSHIRSLTNPKTQFTSCSPIFSASLGLVVSKKNAFSVQERLSLTDSILYLQKATPYFMDPIGSSTGWSAYSELRCMEELLNFPLQYYLDRIRKISSSENELMRVMKADPSAIALLSRDQYLATKNQHDDIQFISLQHSSFSPTYLFCTRDDAPKEIKQLAELLLTYIQTPHAQDFILSSGFTPLPKDTIVPHQATCTGMLRQSLQWRERIKPGHFIFILDTSASMGKNALVTILESVRSTIAHASDTQAFSLILFNSDTKTGPLFSADKNALFSALNDLSNGGGSAVYDALAAGIKLVEKEQSSKYRNHIILLTDGEDTNSDTTLFSLIQSAANTYKNTPYSLDILAIETHSPVHFNDLQEIARTVDGAFARTSMLYLKNALSALPYSQ